MYLPVINTFCNESNVDYYFLFLVTPDDESIYPVECTKANKGHCSCANPKDGFTTYTFVVSGKKRCFTVYHPLSRKNEALPVVISAECYAKDKSIKGGAYDMADTSSARNKAAAKYGYARIAVSSPDKKWKLPSIYFPFKMVLNIIHNKFNLENNTFFKVKLKDKFIFSNA